MSNLHDWADDILPFVTKPSRREDVVPLYARAILMQQFARPPQAETNWRRVNEAIAARWSWSAVAWIKKQAWKRAEQQARELSKA